MLELVAEEDMDCIFLGFVFDGMDGVLLELVAEEDIDGIFLGFVFVSMDSTIF